MKSFRSWVLFSILIHLLLLIALNFQIDAKEEGYEEKKITFDLRPNGQEVSNNLSSQAPSLPMPQNANKVQKPDQHEKIDRELVEKLIENKRPAHLPSDFMTQKEEKNNFLDNASEIPFGNISQGEENSEGNIQSDGIDMAGDIAFDVTDFEGFEEYARHIVAKVRKNWHAPYAFHLGMMEGLCKIQFKIQKDGSITIPDLLKITGHDALDVAAVNAIKASNKFRPLPPKCPEDEMGVVFTFEYILRDKNITQRSTNKRRR